MDNLSSWWIRRRRRRIGSLRTLVFMFRNNSPSGIERPIETQKGQEKRIQIAEAGRSNGPFFFSLPRFKGLGFLEKKPSFDSDEPVLEACAQLDLCPSYPSKSQEEQGRLELLEMKREKRPLGLDGCDER